MSGSASGGYQNSGSRQGLPGPSPDEDGPGTGDSADHQGRAAVRAAAAPGPRGHPGRGRRPAPPAHPAGTVCVWRLVVVALDRVPVLGVVLLLYRLIMSQIFREI